MKPLFSNKGLNSNKLMLLEKSKLVFEEPELAKVIKKYFTNITKNHKVMKYHEKLSSHLCALE